MIIDFFYLLYLAAPAFVANMLPVVAGRLNFLNSLAIPVDNKKKFRDKRILGDHKTVRGFLVGITGATLLGGLQYYLNEGGILMYPVGGLGRALGFGFLAGTGALVGDSVKSFFKRQAGIESGRPFVPFDQIDYIIGFLLFTSFIYSWNISQIAVLLIFALIANPLVNLIAYALGIKKTYW